MRLQSEIFQNALWTIGDLVKAGILKEISLEVIEIILLKSEGLLDHSEEEVVNNALSMLGYLASADMLKRVSPEVIEGVSPEVIECILLKLEGVLDQGTVSPTLWVIGNFAATGMLKEISFKLVERLLLKAKGFLDHNNWLVFLNAVWATLSIGNINEQLLLNMITEAQVGRMHKGILEQTKEFFDKKTKTKKNCMKVLTFLSHHSNTTVQRMSQELLLHIDKM